MLKKMIWITAALVLVVLGAAGCKKKAADPFPASNVVSGWEKTSETQVYPASRLFEYMDGGADQYVQAGVISTATTDYKYQGKLEATVEVHTMKDAAGAQTMFKAGQSSDAKAISVGDAGQQFAQGLTFHKGPYLVRIVTFESTSDSAQAMAALARGIEARL